MNQIKTIFQDLSLYCTKEVPKNNNKRCHFCRGRGQGGSTTKNKSSIYWFSSQLFNETLWKIGLNTKKMFPNLISHWEISEKNIIFFWNFAGINLFMWSEAIFHCTTSNSNLGWKWDWGELPQQKDTVLQFLTHFYLSVQSRLVAT